MNLQRKVYFKLTPATDARLAAKEKLEECLRGLKPDIIIKPTPIVPQVKQGIVKPVSIKKAAKPKRKRLQTRKKKIQLKKKQPAAKKSRQAEKEKPVKQEKTNSTNKSYKRKTKTNKTCST